MRDVAGQSDGRMGLPEPAPAGAIVPLVGGPWEGYVWHAAERGGAARMRRPGESGQGDTKQHQQVWADILECRLIILGSWVRALPALPRLDIQLRV